MRRLVMPGSDSAFGQGAAVAGLNVWTTRRRGTAFVVGSDVPVQVSAYEDIHRCGPGRRRQWLAGSHLETRSVFIDMEGLAAVIERADLLRPAGGPS